MRSRMCPICMWEVKVDRKNELGDIVLCKGCKAEYELRCINPVRLRPLNFYNGDDEYSGFTWTGEEDWDEYGVTF